MWFSVYLYITLTVISSQLEGAVRDNRSRSQTSYNDFSFRRVPACGFWPNEYQCRDGTCITADRKCDGTVDCPDGSDETHYLCRAIPCPNYLFRCTYGGCVDGTAPCNGVSDCADNSDELQPRCFAYSLEIGGQFKCNDSSLIENDRRCDGIRDCADGSDETLWACAGNVCASNLFQCEYGACVDEGADCNDIDECADGSDESDILCNRKIPRVTTTTTTTTTTTATTAVTVPNMCIMPPHPENGLFLKNGVSAEYRPGDVAPAAYLNITCMPGYMVLGEKVIICVSGMWSPYTLPSCVRACELPSSASVEYRCLLRARGEYGTRPCGALEAHGSVVQPECRRPNYYSPTALPYMFCVNGSWSYEPSCQPECGTPTPQAEPLVAGGRSARRGEFPWAAALYRLGDDGYEHICGGSLLNERVVATAAHCVWVNGYGVLPVESFALAMGKLYRAWNDPRDRHYKQTSNVSAIYVADRYSGEANLYQHDLAVVIAKDKFVYRTFIRPVCLDFSYEFNNFQLRSGNIGRAAGMGYTASNKGSESLDLKVIDIRYLEWEECLERIPQEYTGIVGDKICGGYANGTTMCKGDSGAGLVFGTRGHGTLRYYLRGVLSTSPRAPDGAVCNLHALMSFTPVQAHERFLRMHLAQDDV